MLTAATLKLVSTALAAGIAGASGYDVYKSGNLVSLAGGIFVAALALLILPRI